MVRKIRYMSACTGVDGKPSLAAGCGLYGVFGCYLLTRMLTIGGDPTVGPLFAAVSPHLFGV